MGSQPYLPAWLMAYRTRYLVLSWETPDAPSRPLRFRRQDIADSVARVLEQWGCRVAVYHLTELVVRRPVGGGRS